MNKDILATDFYDSIITELEDLKPLRLSEEFKTCIRQGLRHRLSKLESIPLEYMPAEWNNVKELKPRIVKNLLNAAKQLKNTPQLHLNNLASLALIMEPEEYNRTIEVIEEIYCEHKNIIIFNQNHEEAHSTIEAFKKQYKESSFEERYNQLSRALAKRSLSPYCEYPLLELVYLNHYIAYFREQKDTLSIEELKQLTVNKLNFNEFFVKNTLNNHDRLCTLPITLDLLVEKYGFVEGVNKLTDSLKHGLYYKEWSNYFHNQGQYKDLPIEWWSKLV